MAPSPVVAASSSRSAATSAPSTAWPISRPVVAVSSAPSSGAAARTAAAARRSAAARSAGGVRRHAARAASAAPTASATSAWVAGTTTHAGSPVDGLVRRISRSFAAGTSRPPT